MTKEQLLQKIGEIISKYEDDTEQIVGAYIQPTTDDRTETHEWNGQEFCEEKVALKFEVVEGTTEFNTAKEEKIKKRIMDPRYMESLKIKKDV
jgi:F0F1-type ATP synthase membrane subunit b/b'